MMSSGTNSNQNYTNGRKILTRVLAPPGGASSFSLGGYPPENTRKQQIAPPRNEYYGSGSSNYDDRSPEPKAMNRPRRDSLDQLMEHSSSQRGIPGLENHYSNSSRGGSANGRGYQQPRAYEEEEQPYLQSSRRGPAASQQDYASMLREQIMEKKRLSGEDENEGYNSRNRRRERDNTREKDVPSFDRRNDNRYDDNEDYMEPVAPKSTRGALMANDYAALLRQQIEDKKRYDEEDPAMRRVSFLRTEEAVKKPKKRNQIEEVASVKGNRASGTTKYMQVDKSSAKVVVPSVKVRAPPGGASSFSIGWGM